jgi:hypothetical protein
LFNNITEKSFEAVGFEGVDWIQLAEDRVQQWALVNTVMNIQVP